MGSKKKKPMRHREKRSTNSEVLRSNAVFAAVGTTAKHKDDKITIATPKVWVLYFRVFLLKLNSLNFNKIKKKSRPMN